jgi:hypothetical protein
LLIQSHQNFQLPHSNYSILLPKLCQHSISTSRQIRTAPNHMLKQDDD